MAPLLRFAYIDDQNVNASSGIFNLSHSQTKMQLSNARKDLLDNLEQLHVSEDVLTTWREEIYNAALGKKVNGETG